jgi:hypothetical protein
MHSHFQIILRGLWENLGGGSLFSCFIAFLFYNFSVFLGGYMRYTPPPPPCVHLWSTWRCHVHCQTVYRDVAPKLCIFEIFFVKFAKCFWVTVNRPESFFMTHDNELELLFFKKNSTIQIDNFFLLLLSKFKQKYWVKYGIAGLNSGLVCNSIQEP